MPSSFTLYHPAKLNALLIESFSETLHSSIIDADEPNCYDGKSYSLLNLNILVHNNYVILLFCPFIKVSCRYVR